MTGGLIVLALLMAAVTYPSRAVPLLAPAFERLPVRALEYLRLVGPAVLGAIAASQAFVERILHGQPGTVETYLNLLKAGASSVTLAVIAKSEPPRAYAEARVNP